MNLCSDNHEQICFEGHQCPLCAQIGETEKAREHADELENEIKEMNP